jgi:hypothetical protein
MTAGTSTMHGSLSNSFHGNEQVSLFCKSQATILWHLFFYQNSICSNHEILSLYIHIFSRIKAGESANGLLHPLFWPIAPVLQILLVLPPVHHPQLLRHIHLETQFQHHHCITILPYLKH